MLFNISCNRFDEKVILYEDGKTIKIRTQFKNGIKTGLETFYYRDGKIKSMTNWLNGKKHGRSTEYYTNGFLGLSINYHNGVRVGRSACFDSSGNTREIHYFDSTGRKIDLQLFENDGARKNTIFPLGWLKKDTVNLGDTLEFAVALANISSDFRYNEGTFIRGNEFIFDEHGEPHLLKDTIEVIRSNVNNYEVKIKATKKGINFIRGQLILQTGTLLGDTIITNSFEQSYFVK